MGIVVYLCLLLDTLLGAFFAVTIKLLIDLGRLIILLLLLDSAQGQDLFMVTLIELAAFNFRASTKIVRLIFICAQISDDFDSGCGNFSEFPLRRRMLHRLLVTATRLLSLAGALHNAQFSLSFISSRACILMLLLRLG